jgi:hypothetical protein
MSAASEKFDRECRAAGLDPLLVRALDAGVPWPLAREAIASVRLDRGDDGGTQTLGSPTP